MSDDPFEFLRKQQQQIKRLMGSSTLETIRKQQEELRKLVTEAPVLDAMRKQQEEMRKLTTEPRFLEAASRYQEAVHKLDESSFLEAMRKQQKEIRKLTESPRFVQVHEQQRELAEFWAHQPLEPFAKYREELAAQAIQYAETAEADQGSVDDGRVDQGLSLFTFHSIQYLLWQMEGLLKALELMTAAGGAANEIAEDPVVSPKLLAIMLMITLMGELILWFARRPPSQEN